MLGKTIHNIIGTQEAVAASNMNLNTNHRITRSLSTYRVAVHD